MTIAQKTFLFYFKLYIIYSFKLYIIYNSFKLLSPFQNKQLVRRYSYILFHKKLTFYIFKYNLLYFSQFYPPLSPYLFLLYFSLSLSIFMKDTKKDKVIPTTTPVGVLSVDL